MSRLTLWQSNLAPAGGMRRKRNLEPSTWARMLFGFAASAFCDFAEPELVTQRSSPNKSTRPQMRRVDAIFTLAAPSRQTWVSARLFRVRHAFRSILDFGDDVRMMLPRFLVSDQRDPALAPCVWRLLTGIGKALPKRLATP
jgi:hypothetical protein